MQQLHIYKMKTLILGDTEIWVDLRKPLKDDLDKPFLDGNRL